MKQLVSMEDLTNEEIYSLIETAIEYKKVINLINLQTNMLQTCSLKTQHVQNAALKWLNVN